jgi:hypothetical protein
MINDRFVFSEQISEFLPPPVIECGYDCPLESDHCLLGAEALFHSSLDRNQHDPV